MSYLDVLTTLADSTGGRLLAIVTSWQEGLITRPECIALMVAVIGKANARATVLADLGIAADITRAAARPVATAALVVDPEPDRLAKAARTLLAALEDTPDPEARIRRLGRSEPLTRAAEARGEAIADSELVTGWSRQINSADACPLCQWWRREGQVWPADHKMPTHQGCTCTQRPITRRRSA